MSPEFWVAIIGQTVIIVVTVVAAFIRTERRITRVETKVEHVELVQESRWKAAINVQDQVQGISRSLAALEGAHRACPYWAVDLSRTPTEKK